MRNTNRLESKRDRSVAGLYHAGDANAPTLSTTERLERSQEIAAEDLLNAGVAISAIEQVLN
jgi:hypothetical protein